MVSKVYVGVMLWYKVTLCREDSDDTFLDPFCLETTYEKAFNQRCHFIITDSIYAIQSELHRCQPFMHCWPSEGPHGSWVNSCQKKMPVSELQQKYEQIIISWRNAGLFVHVPFIFILLASEQVKIDFTSDAMRKN